ncbi:Utp14 protein [Gigaspora rosea]|uniref:Utp14 protein n=1 Tax=Gigaspora rosea TaxID=44941 RepID=A0A397W1U7_9GLOM|nr:Utp14 protein [Gigaspora rosea]
MGGTVQEEVGFSGLKQKLASFESGGNKGTYKDPLPTSLPQNIQNRLNRQVAYEETKNDISKWEPIVRQNREPDHLKLPMNPILEHTPTIALEKEVDFILVKSGMKEEDLQKYEDIQLSKLSVDEVAARRRELRQERMKLETARAKERMTLKHKNTSKWAKQALKHDLKRKIHDLGSDEDDEDDESTGEKPVKSIMGMKFMQDTMKREKKATQQLIDDFIEDLEDNDFSDDGDDKNKLIKKNNDATKDSAKHINNNLGE